MSIARVKGTAEVLASAHSTLLAIMYVVPEEHLLERKTLPRLGSQEERLLPRKTISRLGSTEQFRQSPTWSFKVDGLSPYDAVVSIILMCFGVGLAVLPKAMSEAGYLFAPLLMVLCAAICSENNIIVAGACSAAEKLSGEPVTSFEDLALISGGNFWVTAIRFSKAFGLLGSTSSFVQFASANILNLFSVCSGMPELVDDPEKFKNENIVRFCVVMPLMILLAMLKDLKQFAHISILGVIAATINGGTIILGGLWSLHQKGMCESQADPGFNAGSCIYLSAFPDQDSWVLDLGTATGTCLFGIMVAGAFPSTRYQMMDKSQLPGVVQSSFWLTLLIYLGVMAAGYVGTGELVSENVLNSFNQAAADAGTSFLDMLRYTGFAAQIVDTLVASPIYILCVINAFETTGTDALHTPLSPANIALRASTVIIVTLLSAVIPYPQIIMIFATLFGIFTHLVAPVFLDSALRRKLALVNSQTPTEMQTSMTRRALRWSTVLFALMAAIFSINGAVVRLVQEMKKP